MAARGSASKEEITQKILKVFEGSFKNEKEIRIPMMENGEMIQIKVTLTAAKTNVENGSDYALPGESLKKVEQSNKSPFAWNGAVQKMNNPTEPSEEEKANLQKLVASLF